MVDKLNLKKIGGLKSTKGVKPSSKNFFASALNEDYLFYNQNKQGKKQLSGVESIMAQINQVEAETAMYKRYLDDSFGKSIDLTG